jgi:hypothetical protein
MLAGTLHYPYTSSAHDLLNWRKDNSVFVNNQILFQECEEYCYYQEHERYQVVPMKVLGFEAEGQDQ